MRGRRRRRASAYGPPATGKTPRSRAGSLRDATAALVLAVTGAPAPPVGGLYEPEINRLSIAISKLSQARGGEWERLDARFAQAANLLHDQTYYGRVYHEDLDDLLREAWDYIRCAEELAGLTAGVAAG